MPSPFPGMDPYLEAPDLWPDLHDRMAAEISAALNRSLPAPYYARLEMRPEVGIVAGTVTRRVVPDVAVARVAAPARGSGPAGVTAVLERAAAERPPTELSPALDAEIPTEPIRHPFVEIRDSSRGHALVTLIEIASPSNKRPGPDRDAYLAKQREVLSSNASLVQIDLLRGGTRPLLDETLAALLSHLGPRSEDYIVLVHRAWERVPPGSVKLQAFPASLGESLPCIPVPLRKGEKETPLDLQFALDRAYDNGPYPRGAVDYSIPPEPPLSGEGAAWADALLRGAGLRE